MSEQAANTQGTGIEATVQAAGTPATNTPVTAQAAAQATAPVTAQATASQAVTAHAVTTQASASQAVGDRISEVEARRVLLAFHSRGFDSDRYEALPRRGGWLFRWGRALSEMPIGTYSWVVANNGRASMVGISESVDEALTRLQGGR